MRLLSLQDPQSSADRVPSSLGEGRLPFPVTDPAAYDIEPATVDTSDTQRLLQRRGERRAEGLRNVAEAAQQRRNRAVKRTLFNALGPSAFKAATGTDVNTGFQQDLRLQREAEKRAAELQREANMEAPLARLKGEIEAERLAQETERQNQEARLAAQEAEAQGLSQYADAVRGLSSTLAEQQTERMRAEAGSEGSADMSIDDALSPVGDNPSLAYNRDYQRAVFERTGGAVTPEMLKATADQQAPSSPEGMTGMTTRALSLQNRLDSARERLGNASSSPESDNYMPPERQSALQERVNQLSNEQEELMSAARAQIGRELSDLRRDLNGPATVSRERLRQATRALGQAETLGMRQVGVGGSTLDVDRLQQQVSSALGQAQSVRGARGAAQPREASGGEESAPSEGQASPDVDTTRFRNEGQYLSGEDRDTSSNGTTTGAAPADSTGQGRQGEAPPATNVETQGGATVLNPDPRPELQSTEQPEQSAPEPEPARAASVSGGEMTRGEVLASVRSDLQSKREQLRQARRDLQRGNFVDDTVRQSVEQRVQRLRSDVQRLQQELQGLQ